MGYLYRGRQGVWVFWGWWWLARLYSLSWVIYMVTPSAFTHYSWVSQPCHDEHLRLDNSLLWVLWSSPICYGMFSSLSGSYL